MATVILLLIKISIVLSVFAIGLNAKLSDTTYFLTRPVQLLKALISINVLMPVLAVLISLTFDLNPAVKIALIVLAVSPVPPIFPNKALKAGGREDYTIGLLVSTAILSVVCIPITIALLQQLVPVEISISVVAILKLVLSTVLLPLLVGILFRVVSSKVADRIARPVGIISMVILVVSVIPVIFISARAVLTIVGDGTLLALGAFAIVGLIVGHLCGGPEPENRPVLALATASRHPAIALAIAHTNFPNQKLVAPCVLVYLILSAILAAPYLNWTKRSKPQAAGNQKHVEV
ncbi:MAG TPA: hypothetical protein VI306_01900 [Pyrinomonadaceae bacterium]